MATQKKHGGKRNGAGRKPADRKKTSVFAYVYEDEIAAVGGREQAKTIAEQAIQRKAKIILK